MNLAMITLFQAFISLCHGVVLKTEEDSYLDDTKVHKSC